METKIKWNEGDGYITATYEGSGSGSASISSDVNEGIDREQSIKVETTDKSVSATLVVSQEGLREVFAPSDGDFILADGGTFNVLKGETQQEGMNVVLQVNADNGQTGIDVYNYMMDNSEVFIFNEGPSYLWTAKYSDNIMLSGTFDGVTLNNARITSSDNTPTNENLYFELSWNGQGSYHVGLLGHDGSVHCWDDD